MAISVDTFFLDAEAQGTLQSRIQQMIGLAFLAPDVLDQVAACNQPVSFTSEWFKRRQLPPEWNKQEQIVREL